MSLQTQLLIVYSHVRSLRFTKNMFSDSMPFQFHVWHIVWVRDYIMPATDKCFQHLKNTLFFWMLKLFWRPLCNIILKGHCTVKCYCLFCVSHMHNKAFSVCMYRSLSSIYNGSWHRLCKSFLQGFECHVSSCGELCAFIIGCSNIQ